MRYLLISLSFLVLFVGCSSRPRPIPPTPTMMDPTLSKDIREVESDSIVFLGNSLTHMGWWRKLFPNVKTANQGIGGNTTWMVLARLDPILAKKPKKIFLLIGANDINFGLNDQQITVIYINIVKKIRTESPDTILYCVSILPFGAKIREYFPQVPSDYKSRIRALNKAIAIICLQQDARYLYVHDGLSDGGDNLKPEYTKDQLHLEPAGYERLIQYYDQHVRN